MTVTKIIRVGFALLALTVPALMQSQKGGPPQSQPPQKEAPLQIIDRRHKVVGRAMNSNFPYAGATVAILELESTTIGLPVSRDGFLKIPGSAVNFSFTTPDCSGQAYMDAGF